MCVCVRMYVCVCMYVSIERMGESMKVRRMKEKDEETKNWKNKEWKKVIQQGIQKKQKQIR